MWNYTDGYLKLSKWNWWRLTKYAQVLIHIYVIVHTKPNQKNDSIHERVPYQILAGPHKFSTTRKAHHIAGSAEIHASKMNMNPMKCEQTH